jgi:excisionase family DNA binding protein
MQKPCQPASMGVRGFSAYLQKQEAAMNRQRRGRKSGKGGGRKDLGSRKERIRARMAASAMASPEELAAVLGISLNKAYEVLRHGKVRAMRLNSRWLIPRTEIARLTGVDVAQVTGSPDVVRLVGGAAAPAIA